MIKKSGKEFCKRLKGSSLTKIFRCNHFILSIFPAVFALLLLLISVIENRWDVLTTNTYPLTQARFGFYHICKMTREKDVVREEWSQVSFNQNDQLSLPEDYYTTFRLICASISITTLAIIATTIYSIRGYKGLNVIATFLYCVSAIISTCGVVIYRKSHDNQQLMKYTDKFFLYGTSSHLAISGTASLYVAALTAFMLVCVSRLS